MLDSSIHPSNHLRLLKARIREKISRYVLRSHQFFVAIGIPISDISVVLTLSSFSLSLTHSRKWLVYWVVFAFFSLIESFIDFLLYWIPFYYAFKLAFLLWAMLPQTKGAKFLYDSFLKDFLKKNESRIDAAMADAKKVSTSFQFLVGNISCRLIFCFSGILHVR